MPATPSGGTLLELDRQRLERAKHAYTTRHLDLSGARFLLTEREPRRGDVVLARIEEIGQHTKIEQRDGRRASLFVGDEVVVAYGDRYAPDQFEAAIPSDLGPCELVAAGGLAARVQEAHGKMDPATSLYPLGLLADADGTAINLRDGALSVDPKTVPSDRPVTIAVVGASMNSGKTTVAAHLVRGLWTAGLRVGAAKTTGTGAGGDVWLLGDAGAFPVYDFTSAGLPSTYRVEPAEIVRVFCELTDRLAADGCEVVVLEIADGLYQQETAALLQDPAFAGRVDALIFASYDAVGADAGNGWLEKCGLPPLALSGVLSSSPLATREAERVTGRQVWGLERLADGEAARQMHQDLSNGRTVLGSRQADDPDSVVELQLASHVSTSGAPVPAANIGDADLNQAV